MDPVWKQKWIEALRSGKYPQTQGNLRKDEGFCCLGVLCDIVDPTKWEKFSDDSEYFYEEQDSNLPNSVEQKTGFSVDYDNFTIDPNYQHLTKLVNMNDGLGAYHYPASFSEIADYIEENL